MNYSDYTIENFERQSYRLTVPCFSGDDDYTSATEMNKFYEKALGTIYLYAKKLMDENNDIIHLECKYNVTKEDDDTTVDLHLTLRKRKQRSINKRVSHTWQNGTIVRKTIK